jgi:uncharacterized membrane protein
MDLSKIVVGVIGISLYMLVPGLALSLAIFPRKDDLGMVDRLGLSIFLGVVVPFIQYFNDKNFYTPINATTTIETLLAVTLIGLIIWQVRLRMPSRKEIQQPSQTP